ncbi:butyrate-acetoacetate CoA-transferase subunit B [Vibrio maritimus]|uniref:Butyrate-acetoacetate CoA-transferase subunit B n=1 Tax=Vibrio maritimus TaxID=990268 RepID=A0A090RN43_9VIBR|nr:butyrate-acetoacetate CoA-transferase subunit B [Vibrio maritimus]
MEHTVKGKPKLLRQCSLPLTAVNQVDLIVTEMGVIKITSKGMLLTELAPEFTVEDVQAATEAKLLVSDNLKPMALPA